MRFQRTQRDATPGAHQSRGTTESATAKTEGEQGTRGGGETGHRGEGRTTPAEITFDLFGVIEDFNDAYGNVRSTEKAHVKC